MPEASSEGQKVLGVHWIASKDVVLFKVHLNFSPKKRNVRTEPDLLPSQVPRSLPLVLTRRLVLQQVMGVFDPYGILASFMLQAKILLWETWIYHLQWDEELPVTLDKRWRDFFSQMIHVTELEYEGCVTPEGAMGKPQLILLSDGSEIAYGSTSVGFYRMARTGVVYSWLNVESPLLTVSPCLRWSWMVRCCQNGAVRW